MYGIIAEDNNDIECLSILINRLSKVINPSIKKKGYSGCSQMLRKGHAALKNFNQRGCTKFIICYDRDKETEQKRYEEVINKLITPSGIKSKNNTICILIPSEEIEAWILADIQAVSNVIPSWKPKKIFNHPETVTNPKEILTNLSRVEKPKPLYIYTIHNQKVLEYIDISVVSQKCPSFKVLVDFVNMGIPNYPRPVTS
jgi:hypothetical protein